MEKGEFCPGEPYLFARDRDGYLFEIWYEIPTAVDPDSVQFTPSAAPRRADPPQDTALVESASDAIIAFDSEGRIVFWNRGAQDLYGWSRREALGLSSEQLLRPRSLACSTILSTEPWDGLARCATRDRGPVTVWSRRTAVCDAKGDPRSTLQIDRDVSSLGQIVDSSLDALIVADHARRILLVNSAAETVFGVTAVDAAGTAVDNLILGTIEAGIPTTGQPVELPNGPHSFREMTGRRADGSEVPLGVTISHLDIGEQRLSVLVCRDITERRSLEEQFRESQRTESNRTAWRSAARSLPVANVGDTWWAASSTSRTLRWNASSPNGLGREGVIDDHHCLLSPVEARGCNASVM